jgi:hypothetical protein
VYDDAYFAASAFLPCILAMHLARVGISKAMVVQILEAELHSNAMVLIISLQ